MLVLYIGHFAHLPHFFYLACDSRKIRQIALRWRLLSNDVGKEELQHSLGEFPKHILLFRKSFSHSVSDSVNIYRCIECIVEQILYHSPYSAVRASILRRTNVFIINGERDQVLSRTCDTFPFDIHKYRSHEHVTKFKKCGSDKEISRQ